MDFIDKIVIYEKYANYMIQKAERAAVERTAKAAWNYLKDFAGVPSEEFVEDMVVDARLYEKQFIEALSPDNVLGKNIKKRSA